MELKIYNKEGVLKLAVPPSENSVRQHEVMADHVLNLSFSLGEYLTIRVNDYVDFAGFRFWAVEEMIPKQVSSVEWEYNCRFYGPESLIRQALMLKLADAENEPVFALTAPAREHAALVVDNINRQMGTTVWKVGEVLVTENLTIDYKGTYCNEALSKIAEAAKTEWWFDGTSVNVCRCEHGEEVPLGYGNGLLSLDRETASNVKFFTRLFPIGGTRNIDPGSYGHSRLQLPGGAAFVDRHTELGIVEHYEEEAFSGIYPRRIGTVSDVRSEERIGDNGKPFTIYYFKDSELEFDPNQYSIGGLVKRVTFRSGKLAEREFEVNYSTKTSEFEIITQWPFGDDMQLPGEPLVPTIGDTYVLWNIRMPESYYRLAEQEYLEAVEAYMAEHDKDRAVYSAATDYVDIAERGLTLDIGQRVRLESETFFPQTGYRTSRITSISQNVLDPAAIDIRMSDVLSKSRLDKIDDDLGAVKHDIQTAKTALPDIIKSWEEIPANDSVLYSAKKSEREFLNKRRGGVVAAPVTFEETVTAQNLVSKDYRPGYFAGSGFRLGRDADGDAVAEVDKLVVRKQAVFNELVINQVTFRIGETVFSNGGFECTKVEEMSDVYRCYYDNKGGRRYSGLIVGDQVRCQRYAADQKKLIKYYWRLVTAVGEDYIDLSKSDADGTGVPEAGDQAAQFGHRTQLARQSAIVINPLNGGSVEVYAGIASYTLSEKNYVGMGVNPTTGRAYNYAYGDMFFGDRDLSDPDANYITFQRREGEARPKLHVKATLEVGRGSTGLTNLSEWQAAQDQIDKSEGDAAAAQAAANEAARATQAVNDYVQLLKSDVNAEIVAVNKRLDGVIETYFFPYDPTLENYPANEWTTNALKERHNGDRFNNTSTGNSWKWKIINSIWKWDEITDSFEKQLLNQIAKAQATADGKIRSFVFEPYPPYSVGDTWDQGPTGDSMRCIRSRASGVFDASDWDKASKYTDDTVAKEAQAAASEAQSSAEKANNALADMANDLKFTPQEKAEMRDVYAQMELDYQSYQGNATTYGVSLTAVTSAYNNLRTYLTDIAKINYKELTTTITAAQGITYDQYRSAWKTSVDNFANAISKKFVDDVQVGGVNLLRWSRNLEKGWINASNKQPDKYQNCTVCFSPPTDAYNEILQQSGKFFDPNSEYTLSFWAKGSGRIRSFCYTFESSSKITATNGLNLGHSSLETFNSYDLSSEWKRFYVTFITGANVSPLKEYRVLLRNSNGTNTCYACGLKLERGNKATYYSESPEDANDKIAQAQDLLADIASDNKLTPSEKQSLKIEWETIVSEHETLNEQAFRLSLLASDYETAFQGLRTYLTPLLENLTTTSDINGPEFRALFNGYYTQSLNLRQQIQSVSTGEIRKVTIDATALDADKFYPVVFSLKQIVASRIRLYADLQDGDIPAWSTHPAGFSADVQWNSIGGGWGTIKVTRHVTSFAFSFAPNTPVGEIGQMEEASKEYIYVRGGGKYYAEATNTTSIDFYPEGYQVNLNGTIYTIPIRDSITEPVVDVDYAKEEAEEANKKLTSWASDGIISPVEKTALRQQQANVMAEYAQIKSDAERYKLATADYTKAYDDAISALGKYTASSPAEITIEADYDHIAAYYVARQVIENAIAEKTDVNFLKDTFVEDATDILGGVVLSSFMGVRDANNRISAGMSGYGEFPFVFAGLGEGADIVEKAKDASFKVDRDAGLGRWGILNITKDGILIENTNGQKLEFRNSDIETIGKLIGGIIPTYTPIGALTLTGLLPTGVQSKRTVESNVFATNYFTAKQGGLGMEVVSTVSSKLINISGPTPDRASVAIKVSLYNSDGGVIDTSDTTYINVTSTSASVVEVKSKLNISSAGTYRLGFKLTAEGNRAQMIDSVSEFVSKIDVTRNVVNFNLTTQKTVIGTNGYAIVYGSRDYLFAVKNNTTQKFELLMAQQSWPAIGDVPIGGVYKDANGFLKVK